MDDQKSTEKRRQLVVRVTEEEYQNVAYCAGLVRRTSSDFVRLVLEDACKQLRKAQAKKVARDSEPSIGMSTDFYRPGE